VLTRELRSNGRNTCRVNGSNASLQFFRTLGEMLVDIHGQSEHLSLLKPANTSAYSTAMRISMTSVAR